MNIYNSFVLLSIFFLFGCGNSQNGQDIQKIESHNTVKFSIMRAPSNSDIVSITQKIHLEFSSPLNINSVNNDTVYLEKLASNGDVLQRVGAYTDVTSGTNGVYLTPYVYLEPSTLYQVVVTTGIKDIDGRSLSTDYKFPFTTAADTVDNRSFAIRSLKPGIDETGIQVGIDIVIDFDAAISEEPAYSGLNYFTVSYDNNAGVTQNISGKVEVFNSLLKFVPDAPLPYDTNITVTLSSNVENLYGISSSALNTSWSFVTTSEQSSAKSDGFYSLNSFETDYSTTALAKFGSKFVVARSGGIDLYGITYIDSIPKANKLYTYPLSSPVTSMLMDTRNLFASTLGGGFYIFHYQLDGSVTVENYLAGESVFEIKYAEMTKERLYVVGPDIGLKIFSFDENSSEINSLYDINKSIVGTALDVEEVEAYDENASEMLKKIYIADYSGGVVILDYNGTFISRTDLNASIKKLAFNENYNGKTSIYAISSSGKIQGLGFDGTIFSNVKAELPGRVSDVSSHLGDYSSNLFYSNYEQGIVKTSGDYIENIISTGGSVVSTAYVDAELDPEYNTTITQGYLLAVNASGKIGFYNVESDTEGPRPQDGEFPNANNLDANISIFLNDSYFDVSQIKSEYFKVYDINKSTSNPIDLSFSKQMSEESATIILDPDENLTDGDTYLITISSDLSDKFQNKLNNGVDANISFIVE